MLKDGGCMMGLAAVQCSASARGKHLGDDVVCFPQTEADLPAVLCRAFNIAQSLAEAVQITVTWREQVLRGAEESTSSWLPFSSKPHAAERVHRAVRHGLVLPSVWQYACLHVPAKLPHQLSEKLFADGLLPA